MTASLLPEDPLRDEIILLLEPLIHDAALLLLLSELLQLVLEVLVLLLALQALNVLLELFYLIKVVLDTLLSQKLAASLLAFFL
jgi:hypothetical protein